METTEEFMPSVFPDKSQSPFTIGDIYTVDSEGYVHFECTLFWNMQPVASVCSRSGPFEPLEWSWIDDSAKDDFASFLRLVKFPTADLFIGSMIACYCNIRYLSDECQADTLFRLPNDPAHIFHRVKLPFTEDVRERVKARYGKEVYFFNDVLPSLLEPRKLLD